MRNNSEKYVQLVERARVLFWKHGIKRVTVEEICLEAGISKMTFYKHFSNKVELARHILGNVLDEAMKKYHAIMVSDKTFEEKVTSLILLKLEGTNEISKEFIKDIYTLDDPGLAQYMEDIRKQSLEMIMDDIMAARQRGEVRQDIKPEFINFFINHLVVLVNDPILNSLYPDGQSIIMELTKFLFYGILPPNHKEAT